MKNILEIIQKRRSIRNFTNQPINDEQLNYLLECARLAPSAVNFQPWHFILVKTENARQKIRQCYDRKWFATAPLYLIACANTSQSWKRPADGKDHADIDVAIAVEHICLAATELGLGCCWVCNFDVVKCCELFELPQELRPVAILPVGFPAAQPANPSPRKNLEDIVSDR